MSTEQRADNWWVVAAAFAVTFVGFGTAYTFSTFLEPLEREFAASRATLSAVFSLAGFLYFTLGVLSGPMADKFGPRRIILAGMSLTAAGLFSASAASSIGQVYMSYGLGVGVGVGLAYVPALAAVQRACPERRGLASGLAVSGIGIGTMVMPPLARLLIDALGWRLAYACLGALALVLGGVATMLLRESRSQPASSQPGGAATTRAAQVLGVVRTSQFRKLYLSCFLCSFGVFVPFVHLVPYAAQQGVSRSSAVLLLTVIGVSSTCGRFLLGGLADRVGQRRAVAMMYVGMSIAFLLWAASASFPLLVIVAITYGAFYGGWVALLPPLVAESFGTANLASVIGVLYTSVGVGTLAGPFAAGVFFDILHSYSAAILGSAGLTAIAAGILWLTPSTLNERTP